MSGVKRTKEGERGGDWDWEEDPGLYRNKAEAWAYGTLIFYLLLPPPAFQLLPRHSKMFGLYLGRKAQAQTRKCPCGPSHFAFQACGIFIVSLPVFVCLSTLTA